MMCLRIVAKKLDSVDFGFHLNLIWIDVTSQVENVVMVSVCCGSGTKVRENDKSCRNTVKRRVVQNETK